MKLEIEHINIIIAFISALLGIAFPLLMQVIQRIDEKYSSIRLVEIFYKEKDYKLFKIFLILSLCNIVLFIILSFTDWKYKDFIIFISSFSLSIFTIIFFFGFIRLIRTYYNPIELINHLGMKLDSKNYQEIRENTNDIENKKFKPIFDIIYYAIRSDDENLDKEAFSFLANYIGKYLDGYVDDDIKHSEDFYRMIRKANGLIVLNKKKYSYFSNNFLLELLLPFKDNLIISERSYIEIWMCLQEQIISNRFDLVYDYWCKAHQYLWLNIPEIFPEYGENWVTIINQEKIDKRNEQRKRFKEFHFALGGLLMYQASQFEKKNDSNSSEIYELINKLSKHTSSQPPQFFLIPDEIDKLIIEYSVFNRQFQYDLVIQQRYPFPYLFHNINHGGIICNWTRKYFAYLFLNLYSIEKYYTYSDPLNLRNTEDKLLSINTLIDSFEFLKNDVGNLLSENDKLNKLGLPIKDNIFFTRGEKAPLELIDQYLDTLISKKESKIKFQELDIKKIDRFKEYSKSKIKEAINNFNPIWNKGKLKWIAQKKYNLSLYTLVDRMAYSKEQDVSYLNHDEILAQKISERYSSLCRNVFRQISSISFSLKKDDINNGINKVIEELNKVGNKDKVIIYFGNNIEIYQLDNKDSIIQINGIYGDLSETFYIINKEQLPLVKPNRIKGRDYIYIKFIDWNNQDIKDKLRSIALKNKLIKLDSRENLDKKVYVEILFQVGVKIKPNIECVCIKCYQQNYENGMPNTIQDIIDTFEENFKEDR
ncbi:MAG: hypothetical protein H6Q15_83 [Bacteroidetes bacterium]|nr:hypothetical protein [Bacteroidota bacterium]